MGAIRLSAVTATFSAIATGILLAGCSFSFGTTPELSAEKLATTLSEKIASTTGQPAPEITCPDVLVGKIGNTTKCKLAAGDGSTLGVSVKVTSVDGDQINFDFKADGSVTPAED
ncbi:DUF4333 domain-containing protein [Streptomyces sp. NPDC059534]|uniref:DUF4333 domain-containing protein n=1 Tax=Streptomyces sp. NPDC059534 TaxID=3346859 RepID=UPI0036A3856F